MANRTWLKGWLVLISVFILGAVCGVVFDWLYLARDNARAASTRRGENVDYLEGLQRELALKPEQTAGLRVILDEMRQDYKAVCADVRPRYDQLRENARQRMRALLTAEQQQRFDLIVTKDDCNCPYLKK